MEVGVEWERLLVQPGALGRPVCVGEREGDTVNIFTREDEYK